MKTGAEKVLEWFNKFEAQNGTPTHFEIKSQLQMAIDEENVVLPQADISGSLLKSIHQDLVVFQQMGFLTPDAKSGLGIAIGQVERYMRNELEPRQQ